MGGGMDDITAWGMLSGVAFLMGLGAGLFVLLGTIGLIKHLLNPSKGK